MVNARDELIKHIEDRRVDFISIVVYNGYYSPVVIKGTLDEVLPKLDFSYDCGFGLQVINGCVWYADGSWSDRGEYDGSEWWQYRCCPDRDTVFRV